MIFLKRNDPRRELNEIVNGARIIMQNEGNSGKWKLKAKDGKLFRLNGRRRSGET